jgi:hypothetical protein
MPASTYNGLKDLRAACPTCGITVSGGTEGGHKSHGPNLPPVDLRDNDTNLTNYIMNNKIKPPQQTTLGPIYTSKVGNRNATFLRESTPPHWHVVFE